MSFHPLTLWTNQLERVRVAADGKVGIGTTGPVGKLHVLGGVDDADVALFSGAASTAYMALQAGATSGRLIHWNGSGFGNIVLCPSGGQVAIGKTVPGYSLDVSGSINITGQYLVNGVPISTGGAAQTPWTSNIDAFGFYLNNVSQVICNATLAPVKIASYPGFGMGVASGTLTFGAGIDPSVGTPQMRLLQDGSLFVTGPMSFNTSISGNGKVVAGTGDSYLRLNESIQFSNGIWLGGSAVKMANGHLYVGTNGGDVGSIDISATASDTVNRITLNGNAGGGILCKNRITLFSDNVTGTYASAAMEIRQTNETQGVTGDNTYAPRIGFHWTGAVASQIGMDGNGIIRTFNNPGNGYEQFACSFLTAYGNVNVTGGYYINGVPLSTGQAQTPWAQAINGNGQTLTGVSGIGINSGMVASHKLIVIPSANPGTGAVTEYPVVIGESSNNGVYRLCFGYGVYYSGIYSGSIQVYSNNTPGFLYLNHMPGAAAGVCIGVPAYTSLNQAWIKNMTVCIALDDAGNRLYFYVRNNGAQLKTGSITIS
jgi:hypothetical protein